MSRQSGNRLKLLPHDDDADIDSSGGQTLVRPARIGLSLARSGAPRPALYTKTARWNHISPAALNPPCHYFVGRNPFDLLTVLLKSTLQIGWAEGLQRASQFFKCHTAHAAPDASVPMAGGEPDGFGKVR